MVYSGLSPHIATSRFRLIPLRRTESFEMLRHRRCFENSVLVQHVASNSSLSHDPSQERRHSPLDVLRRLQHLRMRFTSQERLTPT